MPEFDVISVDGFPQLRAFSRSEDAGERAVFMRVYFDLFEARRARGETMPESWTAALRACLSAAHDAGSPASFDRAAPDDVEATLRRGDLEALIGLANDRTTLLRSDQIEALVARARALSEAGDIRLARAMLARGPVRLEHASLFLDADAEQRLSVLLAVQRAELGRKAGPSRELDPALAEPLEFAAIAGRRAEFADALALALGVSPALAARIGADPGGEALVVALSCLGAPRDLGVRILTARDMSESAGAFPRLHALARLAGQLSAPAARRLIGALAGSPATPLAAPAMAAPRDAETPSPFARRETGRAVSAETAAQPKNVKTVGAR